MKKEKNMELLRNLSETMNTMVNSMSKAMGIEKQAQQAVYSTHSIARHLLSLPDKEVENGWDGLELSESDLGEPKRPFSPAVYTAEAQAHHDRTFNSDQQYIKIRKPICFNGEEGK